LAEFIKEYTFDRMGIFMYSQEEGTVAAEMHHQIPEDIKEQRYHKLMSLQKEISYRKNIQRIGEIYEVIIEGVNEQGSLYYGRSYGEAPEIDGRIYVKSSEKLQIGTFVHVRITKAYDYDLLGEKVNESGE